MIHSLKLNEKYCDDVLYGLKRFEVRFNDRNFKVGDIVHFIPVNSHGITVTHAVSKIYFKITYILSDFCGLSDNYVVFTISKFGRYRK